MVASSIITNTVQGFGVSRIHVPKNIRKQQRKVVWLELEFLTCGLKHSFLLVWHVDK